MPQQMQILKCYSCEACQVHIVKKVPKWECKICGKKQSVKKVYATGPGKDCRLHVQRLNQNRLKRSAPEPCISEAPIENSVYSGNINSNTMIADIKPNRWAEFMHSTSNDEDSEIEPIDMSDYPFKKPSNKRRRRVLHQEYIPDHSSRVSDEKGKCLSQSSVKINENNTEVNEICKQYKQPELNQNFTKEEKALNATVASATSKWAEFIAPTETSFDTPTEDCISNNANLTMTNINTVANSHNGEPAVLSPLKETSDKQNIENENLGKNKLEEILTVVEQVPTKHTKTSSTDAEKQTNRSHLFHSDDGDLDSVLML